MKIKANRIIYLLFSLFIIGSTSCNKLLDIPPQNKLTLDEYWLSKQQAIAFIGGIYNNMEGSGSMSANSMSPLESFIYWGEIRGDILQNNMGRLSSTIVSRENVDNFVVTPNDATTKFTQFYKVINEANQAIKHLPDVRKNDPNFTSVDEDNLTGEAYFIRAFSYFWLVRTFKEVPLILFPSETDNENYNIPKSSASDIYAQIAEDLETAKNLLPEWYDNPTYSHIRATKYTAMAVLSDAYLWMAALSNDNGEKSSYYQKVIDNCTTIISSGRFFMIPGVNYADIWAKGCTEESIFETYANSKLNNQTNNLYSWFTNPIIWKVTLVTDNLWNSVNPDYRGIRVPSESFPPPSVVVTYNVNTRDVMKYSKTTRDAVWNFYRYPDLLFMKAEALTHLFPNNPEKLQEACDLVNEVRYRAFLISDYEKVTGGSALELDNIILDERAREFVGEGRRWFDLVRFASRDNFANPELLINRVVESYPSLNQTVMSVRIKNPEAWYLPLNAGALTANPALVQNPYYH